MIANDVHHDGAFWGIRFPVSTSSFYQTAIYVIQEDLEGCGDTVQEACLEGFYFAVVVNAVIVERDRKFIKHKSSFLFFL
jgi:hypothetical protein